MARAAKNSFGFQAGRTEGVVGLVGGGKQEFLGGPGKVEDHNGEALGDGGGYAGHHPNRY